MNELIKENKVPWPYGLMFLPSHGFFHLNWRVLLLRKFSVCPNQFPLPFSEQIFKLSQLTDTFLFLHFHSADNQSAFYLTEETDAKSKLPTHLPAARFAPAFSSPPT